MGSKQMSVTSRFGTSEAVDNAPLWKYVTKMDKVGDEVETKVLHIIIVFVL